jgi:mono/diheme cytochrome c family protein
MVVAIAVVLLPNAFAQEKAAKPDGKAIFEQKCLKCHKPEKFKSQHNDKKGWELILSRMERNSCALSDQEQVVLADYLAKVHGE